MSTISEYEITDGIYAPTSGKLNFKWKYSKVDLFGWFPSNNTHIYTNGQNGEKEVSELTGEEWDSEYSESITIDANINYLHWDRPTGNTHKVTIYSIAIPLAQHILLADGTYGATTKTYNFGEVNALSSSEAYRVSLRSFLSAGDITVTTSEPEIFHLDSADNTSASMTYAVGANACASANGTAEAASGGTLGNIENYNFDLYFTPKAGKIYAAVITITDGTSTATLTVTGTGVKLDQTITWELDKTAVLSNYSIEPASASSGLDVAYSFSPEGIVEYTNGGLQIVGEGTVQMTASQAGNEVYNAATDVVKTLTIYPAVVYSNYEAAICQGDSYSDALFADLTESGTYVDTLKTTYGGDSVITLQLTVNPTYYYNDTLSHYVGMPGEWQAVDLSTLSVGDTTLVANYKTVAGCDSVYTCHLTILPSPTLYGAHMINLCEGESGEFEGKSYSASTVDSVLLAEKNMYGGDSIVVVTVAVHPVTKSEETKTIYVGDTESWQAIDLSVLPIGDTTLVAEYQTVYGCDSTYTLYLSVVERPTTYGAYTMNVCEGESGEFAGKSYSASTEDSVLLEEKNMYGGDSIVVLTVAVHPVAKSEETLSISEGDNVSWQAIDLSVLPVGDTTLVAEYQTVYGCDSTYTLYLTVVARPTTYGNDTLYTCAGEPIEYEGKTYKRTMTDSVLLAQKNIYGGDSIVALSVYVYPNMRVKEQKTIMLGEAVVWQNIDLSAFPLGDTTLVAEYQTVYGCDSTYTLSLTVIPCPTTYGNYTIHLCEGDSAEYAGKQYMQPTTDSVLLAEKNHFGGDSVVALSVYVHPLTYVEDTMSIRVGETIVWQNVDLSEIPVGDTTLVAEYQSAYGCDSTYTLLLTVLPRPTTYGHYVLSLCEGESAEYAGKQYTQSATDSILLDQKNAQGGDSILVLTVEVNPVSLIYDTLAITEGDSITWQQIDLSAIPAGDTTLVAYYQTIYGCDSTYVLALTVEAKSVIDPHEGVEQVEMDAEQSMKFIMDGQLYIRKGDMLYDVTGRRVRAKK